MKKTTQEKTFKQVYFTLMKKGISLNPRGLKIKEIENFSVDLKPYVRFINFTDRKLDLDYIKTEFLWYLRGNEYDTTISKYAKIWKSCINGDGTINSNYGQYIFGKENQYQYVLETLMKDKDSRRASIMILSAEHLRMKNDDVPCTYSINFRIRENKLNMTVRMRSQDAIYGMGNDIPCFSFIHEMMFHSLKATYPELEYGIYHHSVDSFHIYEKHFDLLEKIVTDKTEFNVVECPAISSKEEVDYLRNLDYSKIPESFKFTKWLTTFKKDKYKEVSKDIITENIKQLTLFYF